jgi:hypothetical protein
MGGAVVEEEIQVTKRGISVPWAVAGAILMGTAGVSGGGYLGTSVGAAELTEVKEELEEIEAEVNRQARNEMVLDLQLRTVKQTVEHTDEKVDRVLQALDVESPPKPVLEPSQLEEHR